MQFTLQQRIATPCSNAMQHTATMYLCINTSGDPHKYFYEVFSITELALQFTL